MKAIDLHFWCWDEGSPAIPGDKQEDVDTDEETTNFPFSSQTQSEKQKTAERMLSWHMTYGRGEDTNTPNYDKEVSPNHIPLLTSGQEVSGELSAASPQRLSVSSPPPGGERLTSTTPFVCIGKAFGNQVSDNILISLEKPTWLIAIANLMVVIHVIGSYQIYAMPVFDMIETVLVKNLNFTPSFTLRFITRNLYVALTMFIGICFPFFGGLLGFFGGFAFAPTTYFLPCIMWLTIYKPNKWSLSWIANWVCICNHDYRGG